MDITDIRVRRAFDNGKLKAIVSVTFDDAFVVHDIKIIEGQNGLFIAMPSRQTNNGEYKDICHPINKESREHIEDAVIGYFEESESRLSEDRARERERNLVLETDEEEEIEE